MTTRYSCICLLFLYTSCTSPTHDKRVISHLDLYENMAGEIRKEQDLLLKIGSRIDFNYSYNLSDFKSDCANCQTSQIVARIKEEAILNGFVILNDEDIRFFLKKEEAYYMTLYYHSLIYNTKEIPVFNNSEGDTQFELIRQDEIKKNWYYRVVAMYN